MKIFAWFFYVMLCLFLLQCGSDKTEQKPAEKKAAPAAEAKTAPPSKMEQIVESNEPLLPGDKAGAEKRFIEIVKEYQAALDRHLEDCRRLKKEVTEENRREKRNAYAEKYTAEYAPAYLILMKAQYEYIEKAGVGGFQALFEKYPFLNALYEGKKGKRRSLPAREGPCRP